MSDFEIPKSFNKSLLEKALLEYTKDPSFQLIDYKIEDNLADISEHFSSIVFKVDLEYKRVAYNNDEVFHIGAIVKTLPDASPDESHNLYFTQFATELNVYDKILPKMELMLYGIGLNSLAPRQIYQTSDPVPILIMENMISTGYTTITDRGQISFDSARLLIGKLAQFHATSLLLDKQMDDTIATLNGVNFDEFMDKSYCKDMDKCIVAMGKLNGFENIVAKLDSSTEEIFEAVRKVYYGKDEAACKVLCHGDMKFENTLIQMNENDIENGIFVDFAYANFNTPVIDLFEFLYKVPALDVIMQKELRDELIHCYLDVFRTVLVTIGFEGADETIQSIKNEMHRCNVLQVWFVMFLAVYKLELFNGDIEADVAVLSYEEKWLKTVLDALLNENDE